jgi:hypothetical protein
MGGRRSASLLKRQQSQPREIYSAWQKQSRQQHTVACALKLHELCAIHKILYSI